MAVPKFRTSKARTRRRQAINMQLSEPKMITCGNCGNQVLLHRVCPQCGHYRGKQVALPTAKA